MLVLLRGLVPEPLWPLVFVAVFLLIGLVKGAVKLVRIGIRMLQDKKR
jgi:hypothetical protein